MLHLPLLLIFNHPLDQQQARHISANPLNNQRKNQPFDPNMVRAARLKEQRVNMPELDSPNSARFTQHISAPSTRSSYRPAHSNSGRSLKNLNTLSHSICLWLAES